VVRRDFDAVVEALSALRVRLRDMCPATQAREVDRLVARLCCPRCDRSRDVDTRFRRN
jgi:hypothetical protein